MPTDAQRDIFSVGTSLAAAAVAIASVGSVLLGPFPNPGPLVACAALYVITVIVGALAVQRQKRGHGFLIAALFVLGSAAVWISRGGTILILMPLICLAVVYYSVRVAALVTA